MASNGGERGEQLAKVEAAIAANKPSADNLMVRMDSLVTLCHDIAHGFGDVGVHDSEEVHAFAVHIDKQIRQYASELLARKRREFAHLERILGPVVATK
jgi:hypothetical protein